jgi:hypothetical protein
MKKSIVLPFLLLFFYFSSAQEVYFTHGKNLTNYEQLNINTNSLPVDRGIGSSFEIGFKSKYIKNTSFFYTLGLTYNQFNALGNTTGLNMEWKTNYVGLSSSFDYSLIQAKRSTLSLKLGTSMQTLVYGKQQINLVQMDILNNREFSGLNIGLQSGLVYQYQINPDYGVNIGYTYMQLFNLSNSTEEKSLLTNQNVSVGFTVKIK